MYGEEADPFSETYVLYYIVIHSPPSCHPTPMTFAKLTRENYKNSFDSAKK
jgi:hypothetical protein